METIQISNLGAATQKNNNAAAVMSNDDNKTLAHKKSENRNGIDNKDATTDTDHQTTTAKDTNEDDVSLQESRNNHGIVGVGDGNAAELTSANNDKNDFDSLQEVINNHGIVVIGRQ